MSLTNSQFNFLLREKAIHTNTQITVKKSGQVKVTDNYSVPRNVLISANLHKVYCTPDDKYQLVYYKMPNMEKHYVCSLEELYQIEGQDADRYFKAMEDLMENTNAYTFDVATNVVKEVIGKAKANINGIELYDGMKLILSNDKTAKYNNKILNVRGYGKKIKLCCNAGRPKTHINEEPKIKKKRGRKLGWRKNDPSTWK